MNKRAFTLIEVLVAALLFLAATIGFAYILKYGAASVAKASELNQAAYTIESKMEEIRSTSFYSLPSLSGRTFAMGAGKITVITVLANLTQISLELKWDPSRLPLKLYTLRSKY